MTIRDSGIPVGIYDTPKRTKLDAALDEFANNVFACGEWDGEETEKYRVLLNKCEATRKAVKALVREMLVAVQDQLWNQEYTPGRSPWGRFKQAADAILNEPEE